MTRKKTLLLVFIHGFKGGDDTFARFPPHLRALLSHALPRLTVAHVVYPKFETRGDLAESVASFKEWLQNKVIDLEVANSTPSPTVDPSVRVLLIGHSMGGIVGAETILSIAGDAPVPYHTPTSSSHQDEAPPSPVNSMFPSIVGLLAFDTPYLGISPGVLAHGAEQHYQTVSSAWTAYNSVTDAFGMAGTSAANKSKPAAPAPAPPTAPKLPSASDADVASVPAWQRWGKVAMYAGAAGAVIAGGAAAYANRGVISEGWKWSTSHLEFVNCLARPKELEVRVSETVRTAEQRHFGFLNLYTQLGRGASAITVKESDTKIPGSNTPETGGWVQTIAGSNRTFCNVPKSEVKSFFEPTVNEKAESEVGAHMAMFTPRDNPGYYSMSERAKEVITKWVTEHWVMPDDEETEPGAAEKSKDPRLASDDDVEIVEKEDIEMEL